MEQCTFITNSDDVRSGVAPAHPTAYEQLRQRVALSYKPHQVSTVTSSEAVFLASLSPSERNYVEELREAYDEYYHGRTTRDEFLEECESAAIMALDSTPDRKRAIKESAVRFLMAEFKAEGHRARIKLRKRVEKAAYAFKVGDRRHIGGHERFSFQMACNHSYRDARHHLVTKNQARNIAYSIARKMNLHSAEQLWRYMTTNHVLLAIEQLHFA